jgi:cell division protein FtsB
MTLKTAKLQIDQLQQENEQLKLLVASLEDKINILKNTIDKLKTLNYIQDKYNIPGN